MEEEANQSLGGSPPKKKQKGNTFYPCVECNVEFNSQAQYAGHVKGKKHKNKAKNRAAEKERQETVHSDTEDYDLFRKNARPRKNKNRVRVRVKESEKESETKSQMPTPKTTTILRPTVKRQVTPFFSPYCTLQHDCMIEKKAACSTCKQDLRQCKLSVSITNAKIQFIYFDIKEKFSSYEEKTIAFLQSFVLLVDLRCSVSVFKAFKWTVPLFKEFSRSLVELEELKKSVAMHSIECAVILKLREIQKDIDAIISQKEKESKAQGIAGKWEWENILRLCCFLDEIYYNLFYCWNTVMRGYQKARSEETHYSSVWTPKRYFEYIEKLCSDITTLSSSAIRQRHWKSVGLSKAEIRALESSVWKGNNELLDIHLLRYTETIRLFPKKFGLCLPERKKVKTSHSREPPCSDIEQLWRNSCRDWLCHLYAYAVPNESSLNALHSLSSSLIEVGAGTGYWGSLLLDLAEGSDNKIYLYDSHPLPVAPQPEESKKSKQSNYANDYHGKAIAFAPIAKGGNLELKVLSTQPAGSDSALVLCYPPPGSSMALDCLSHFNGTFVVYIGEWQGDTGTAEFESELLASFTLVRSIGLPNWSNTCFSLTIWQRKTKEIQEEGAGVAEENLVEKVDQSSLVALLSAGAVPLQCTNCGRSEKRVRRCYYCAGVSYCSSSCAEQHSTIHSQLHAFYHILYDEKPQFDNKDHFQRIRINKI